MAKGASRLNRKQALCSILTGTHIDQWIGKATSLTTNSSGKGIVAVEIAPGVTIKTFNNELSDAFDHTLLSQDLTVFRQAMTLKEGDTISFGGDFTPNDIDCVEETSITLKGSMTEPEFLFHFTSIESPREASPSPPPTSLTPTTAVPALDHPPAMPQPTGTGPVTMYDKGLADRAAWENWFNSLQADIKTGAFFWAGQRSLPHPGSCSQMNADFYNGCTAAKERLATADGLRMSETEYKRGWNAYGAASYEGTPTAGANSGRTTPQDHSVGRPIPLHARSAKARLTAPAVPSAQTAAGSNFPDPKCFTVYPAIPPADCFAH